jgi:uncharacterized protein YjiS (DUF1127 family)
MHRTTDAACCTVQPAGILTGRLVSTLLKHGAGAVLGVLRWAHAAHQRRQAVAELMAFDDRRLRDIGLTRTSIQAAVYGPTGSAMPAQRRNGY